MMNHQRKCFDCGNVATHSDNIVPEVLCKVCRSQDTRAMPPSKSEINDAIKAIYRKAMEADVLTAEEVSLMLSNQYASVSQKRLCLSHERLRAECEASAILIAGLEGRLEASRMMVDSLKQNPRGSK